MKRRVAAMPDSKRAAVCWECGMMRAVKNILEPPPESDFISSVGTDVLARYSRRT